VLTSVAEPKPHHSGRAGAVTPCSSSVNTDVQHKNMLKNEYNLNNFSYFLYSNFQLFKSLINKKKNAINQNANFLNFDFLFEGTEQEPELESHQNDAAPQHWF
jgi:hypothetical protein